MSPDLSITSTTGPLHQSDHNGPSMAMATIPDHELIRCVGQGAYGEVWLARNVLGAYRAIKIVYRKSFRDERSYEREFHGIQNY